MSCSANSEKIDTQEKKLLYQLESIVKTLYPNHKTINPYDQYLEAYYNELEIEDVLLFKRLLKSLTIINHKERLLETSKYVSTYADVLTTMELLSRYRINDVVLRAYVSLKSIFKENTFTKLQASRVLRKSVRSVERYLDLWEHLNLVKRTNLREGSKRLYQLMSYESPNPIYEEMQEEY